MQALQLFRTIAGVQGFQAAGRAAAWVWVASTYNFKSRMNQRTNFSPGVWTVGQPQRKNLVKHSKTNTSNPLCHCKITWEPYSPSSVRAALPKRPSWLAFSSLNDSPQRGRDTERDWAPGAPIRPRHRALKMKWYSPQAVTSCPKSMLHAACSLVERFGSSTQRSSVMTSWHVSCELAMWLFASKVGGLKGSFIIFEPSCKWAPRNATFDFLRLAEALKHPNSYNLKHLHAKTTNFALQPITPKLQEQHSKGDVQTGQTPLLGCGDFDVSVKPQTSAVEFVEEPSTSCA